MDTALHLKYDNAKLHSSNTNMYGYICSSGPQIFFTTGFLEQRSTSRLPTRLQIQIHYSKAILLMEIYI